LFDETFAAHNRFESKRKKVGDAAPALPDWHRATAAIRDIEIQRRAGQDVDVDRVLKVVGCSTRDIEGLSPDEAIDFAITGRRARPATGVLEDAERRLRMAKEAKRRYDEELAKEAERDAEMRGRFADASLRGTI
jgi:hypothetical protein